MCVVIRIRRHLSSYHDVLDGVDCELIHAQTLCCSGVEPGESVTDSGHVAQLEDRSGDIGKAVGSRPTVSILPWHAKLVGSLTFNQVNLRGFDSRPRYYGK